ncbi:hypothetical protein K3G63_01425 [Hymenobacter sp. HSC-4F20]|uniref:hypothetical protein n=1 Tax=Hymenobacter sp. HSC-4F20 TaxID=2864135 RepID=UPI001C73682D|nr:hypothetical protein [Hymenobacter sp. HSC-4F20]MBX0289076.1 hypothetical protein [Hymenobacter sp. HSC-4F20]
MTVPTATTDLQLHLVPAGCRLDFTRQPGRFAYVYRRQVNQAWKCIAHNACSPHIDRTLPASGGTVEYMVCYCDAAGNITEATPIVQAQLPSQPAHSQARNAGQTPRPRPLA